MLDVFITSRVRRKIIVVYAKYPDFRTHVRGLAKLIKENSIVYIDNNCIEQIREVRALKWFTYDEVLSHIKCHNVERIEIFKKAHNIIVSAENKNI